MAEAPSACDAIDQDEGADDMALVQAVRDDASAFGVLYQRYRDRVYWYLRTRALIAEDAGDLLQQVFLLAFDRLPQYNPNRGPFVSWLFGIARHTASNHRRGQRATVSWDLVPEVLRPMSQDDPEARALERESLARLAGIFAALDRDRRELLVLRYVAGLNFAEIAAIVGKSEPATRQQVSRLLRRLKEQYRDDVQ